MVTMAAIEALPIERQQLPQVPRPISPHQENAGNARDSRAKN
jgi:hypothetical protein